MRTVTIDEHELRELVNTALNASWLLTQTGKGLKAQAFTDANNLYLGLSRMQDRLTEEKEA